VQPTPSVEPTPYPDLVDNAPSRLVGNLAGILLILLVIGLTIFAFLRRTKKADRG
jgi:hypothetical protein